LESRKSSDIEKEIEAAEPKKLERMVRSNATKKVIKQRHGSLEDQ